MTFHQSLKTLAMLALGGALLSAPASAQPASGGASGGGAAQGGEGTPGGGTGKPGATTTGTTGADIGTSTAPNSAGGAVVPAPGTAPAQ